MPSKTELKQRQQVAASVCREAKCRFVDLHDLDQNFVRAHAATLAQGAIPTRTQIRKVADQLKVRLQRPSIAPSPNSFLAHTTTLPDVHQSPGGGGQARRLLALQRVNKLRQDSEWQGQLQEAFAAEQADRAGREEKERRRIAEQRRVLDQQIEEREQARRAEAEELRAHHAALHAQTAKDLADEKEERLQRARLVADERARREAVRDQQQAIRKRESDYHRRLEAEELEAVQRAMEQARQDDVRRKQRQAAHARELTQENEQRVQDRQARQAAEQERERKLLEQGAEEMRRRENAAAAELGARSGRAGVVTAKQAAVLPFFEKAHQQRVDAQRRADEAAQSVIDNDVRLLQERKDREAAQRTSNRAALSVALEEQMEAKTAGRAKAKAADTELMAQRVGLAIVTDQQQEKELQARKKELFTVLATQMKEKDVRSRMPLQVKF